MCTKQINAESSKWLQVLTSKRQLWDRGRAVPQKQSSQRSKCQRRHSSSGSGLTRGSISLWCGYVQKWTIKTSLFCLCFGALFVGSMRQYVGPITSLFNVSQWNVSGQHSVVAGQVTLSSLTKFRLLWVPCNPTPERSSQVSQDCCKCIAWMPIAIYIYIAARVQLMAGIKRKASFVWNRKQWQFIAMHEIDTRALSDDWKLWEKMAGWLCNVGEMHIYIRARTAGETKCCIEETAQLNLQQKNVRAEKLKV